MSSPLTYLTNMPSPASSPRASSTLSERVSTTQRPSQTCSASFSTDNESSHAYTQLFVMSNNGLTTLMPNNGKRLTITSGIMTAELLHHFKHFTHGYLANRENLAKAEYVVHIAYVFEDPLFSDWFQTSQSYYKKLSFAEFMAEVHAQWLTVGWEKELARKVCNTNSFPRFLPKHSL